MAPSLSYLDLKLFFFPVLFVFVDLSLSVPFPFYTPTLSFKPAQMTDEKGVEDPVVDLGDSLAVEGEFRDAMLADGEDSAQWQASQEPASFVVMSEQVC